MTAPELPRYELQPARSVNQRRLIAEWQREVRRERHARANAGKDRRHGKRNYVLALKRLHAATHALHAAGLLKLLEPMEPKESTRP